jgi:hypothetical protein
MRFSANLTGWAKMHVEATAQPLVPSARPKGLKPPPQLVIDAPALPSMSTAPTGYFLVPQQQQQSQYATQSQSQFQAAPAMPLPHTNPLAKWMPMGLTNAVRTQTSIPT